VRQDPGGVSLLAGHHLPEAACRLHQATLFLPTSVPDTDPPDPPDPNVFGPPGSGSISQTLRYGSGSFYHQAKIVRKTLIPTVL
jgi:hypothetical protein